MTFGEDMKRKADEVHLQDKAKDFGDAVAELVRAAVGMVGGFAAENREKVDVALDKAQAKVAENTSEKHTDTVTKVRSQVDKGFDKLVEQRDKAGRPTGSPAGATNARPGAEWPSTPVPDDMHSAFDDNDEDGDGADFVAGSPS
ncbi:MAG: antitoxin [Humibacillus sp.]|nr:antitoxin [Humibacillus sp.]MDN5776792.1 antitoxin [Humibacillus sp.]